MKICIKGGRVIDPESDGDKVQDVFISDSIIVGIGQSPRGFMADKIINASRLAICPGLVDVSVRVGGHGSEFKTTLEQELRSALAGGVTKLGCPPDTTPVLDQPGLVTMLRERATALNSAKIFPIGAMTQSLSGKLLAEMAALSDAGCVAFSQGDGVLPDAAVLKKAMEYAATFSFRIFLRPQERSLGNRGIAHEGSVSTRLGLPGVPVIAETLAVSNILMLAKETGAMVHLSKLSSYAAVELVRNAKQDGVDVTSDVSVHNLHLCDIDIGYFDTNFNLCPPLRASRDKDALREGLRDDTVNLICSDHYPVSQDQKNVPFAEAIPGASSVELLLPLTLQWAREEGQTLLKAVTQITSNPSHVLGISPSSISIGEVADLCIFDPEHPWIVSDKSLVSAGKNTPFINKELVGRVLCTIVEGRIAYDPDEICA